MSSTLLQRDHLTALRVGQHFDESCDRAFKFLDGGSERVRSAGQRFDMAGQHRRGRTCLGYAIVRVPQGAQLFDLALRRFDGAQLGFDLGPQIKVICVE